jgi:hypothetical protein
LQGVVVLRALAAEVAGQLAAPQAEPGVLRRVATMLTTAVTGTVVEQAGQALVHAIGGLLS